MLDRLLGSMTIVQTIVTQLQTRSLSFLSMFLILLWSLSPLGGQASLRIIDPATELTNSKRLLQYVNTCSDVLGNSVYTAGDPESLWVQVNVLFGAAMMSGTSSLSSTKGSGDTWGNTKIPWIESLDPSTAKADGWYPVPQLNSSDNFTSLIGIPLSMISDANNLTTSFSIETSYWTLSCPVFGTVDPSVADNATGYNANSPAVNLYLFSDPPVNMRPRRITYLDDNSASGDWTGANCTIRNTYVEVSMICSTGSCTPAEMRKSHNPCAPDSSDSWTQFDRPGGDLWSDFGDPFVDVFKPTFTGVESPYQRFIINPHDPFDTVYGDTPVTTVSNSTFALRLSQLLNTYWMAMLAPGAIPKGLRNSNFTADTSNILLAASLVLNTTATETRGALVLECHTVWFVILLLSSAVTALIGLCGLVAAICRHGPDVSFNISSLVKDSPFFDQTSVATTLSGTDRSRLMKDWYAKYGDVAPEDEVGYIAIGSGNVADLQTGRLYR
jgi:hypothetical protein